MPRLDTMTADPKTLVDEIYKMVKQGSNKDVDFAIGIITEVLIRLFEIKNRKK